MRPPHLVMKLVTFCSRAVSDRSAMKHPPFMGIAELLNSSSNSLSFEIYGAFIIGLHCDMKWETGQFGFHDLNILKSDPWEEGGKT